VSLVIALLVGLPLVRLAYRRGRAHATRFPSLLLEELAAHKRDCLGEAPERVSLEIALLTGGTAQGRGRG
jgi:hypothetical protein